MERFLDVARQLGFDSKQMDRTNKMFLLAEFKKSNRKPQEGVAFEAKVWDCCRIVFSKAARAKRERFGDGLAFVASRN